MIREIGVGFRDAVSLIMRRTWVRGSVKSKATLSGRSQAFLQTPGDGCVHAVLSGHARGVWG